MATQVNDANFDAVVLQSQLPVLVDFWAPCAAPAVRSAPSSKNFPMNMKARFPW